MIFQQLNFSVTSLILIILCMGILLGISIFFSSMGDKSQLLKPPIYLLLVFTTIIPAYLFLIIQYFNVGAQFVQQFGVYLISLSVLMFIWNTILKQFVYRTIPFVELQKQKIINKGKVILKVEDLKTYYPIYKGLFKRHTADVKAVDGVSFELKTGETFG